MADVMQVNGYENKYMHDDRSALYDVGRERMDELLRSEEFRDEVGEIVQQQIEKGVLAPSSSSMHNNNLSPSSSSNYRQAYRPTVLPVSDIRGVDTLNYRKGEKLMRCKLASCYRLLDITTRPSAAAYVNDTHISARLGVNEMLMSPRGMLYSEVTASSLVKLSTGSPRSEVLDEGTSGLDPCSEQSALHALVYNSRPSVNSVIHINNTSTTAVSVMRCGLLPLCEEAMLLLGGDTVAYYDYCGSATDPDEAADIKKALGDTRQVLFLRNFGAMVVGETLEEAYKIASNVVTACETQVNVVGAGLENLYVPSTEIVHLVYTQDRDLPPQVPAQLNQQQVEFEALMRKLDHEGHCTGYVYHDSTSSRLQRSVSDYTTSLGGKSSVLDDRATTPLNSLLMKGKRPEFVVSPNTYRKEDQIDYATIGSTGVRSQPQHQRVSRWVSSSGDESITATNRPKFRSASLKNTPHKFAPQGKNPNELRQKVKEIRKEYFDDTITAGPQSTVLEGVTWEEARRIKEGQQQMAGVDNIRVSAASRGVIQREHQRDALFYKKFTLNNPFDNVTDEEIEKYKREIQKKSKKSAYGKYAESEPEFLSESRQQQQQQQQLQQRATTPPPKPARMSPTPNNNTVTSKPQFVDDDDGGLRSGSVKPVQVTTPQPKPLTPQNISPEVNKEKDFPKRSQSARYPNERRPDTSNRSTLLDAPAGHSATLDNRSSKENSPVKDGTLTKDKKKKRGLRLPSFSKKKEKQ